MISIIMGTYNGGVFLSEQIESILAQAATDWRLFIFDDGSSDDTEAIARAYEEKFPEKIKFFRNEANHGAKGNFFQGLMRVFKKEAPDSEYFAFSDQDDVWDRKRLSLGLEKMKEVEGDGSLPVAVFSDVKLVNKELEVLKESYFSTAKLDKKKLDFASLLMENKAIGGTMLLNSRMVRLEAEAEEKMGTYPKKAKMHDWWFALLGSGLGRVGFIEEATEAYRQHETNVVGGESFFSYVKNRIFSFTEIRKRLIQNVSQGEEFFSYFSPHLSASKKEVLEDFISLKESGFLRRRRLIVKHGFYKSGFVRNIGLFLFL